jgi:outer membrane protein OmpA-like peptidoglycan-associated protein
MQSVQRNRNAIRLAIAALGLFYAVACAAQSAERGTDHPMFSRYPGSEIKEYRQLEFAQTELAAGFTDKTKPAAPTKRSFEGKTTTIIYELEGNQSQSEQALRAISDYLKKNPQQSFYVVGHSDTAGSYEHNVDLSRRRAQAVVAALTGKYAVAKPRLTAVGVGPVAPSGTNANDAGRARNRRVELVLR